MGKGCLKSEQNLIDSYITIHYKYTPNFEEASEIQNEITG